MSGNSNRVTTVVAVIAAIVSAAGAFISFQAMKSSERISMQAQRASVFAQFQEHYNAVSSRFPPRFLDPAFKPKAGTDEYARLEAYWFFCFSEWYATHKTNPEAIGDLWEGYYTPLIADALEIASLRYVLEHRIKTRGRGQNLWTEYLRALGKIARDSGRPLDPDAQEILDAIASHTTPEDSDQNRT